MRKHLGINRWSTQVLHAVLVVRKVTECETVRAQTPVNG